MVYLDNASTTKMCAAAKQAVLNNIDNFGNPSSLHSKGRDALLAIEDARSRIAKCINAEPDEIIFTSGGSEANTLALKNHYVLATNIEHHSISADSDNMKVSNDGVIDLSNIESTIRNFNNIVRPFHPYISCMYVNNEIGTIQPVRELAEIVHKNNGRIHTDAVQAVGHLPIDVKYLNVDAMSMSGHKFGAMKGVGALYVKKGYQLSNIINGGKQENGIRPGTENVLGIISMAAALEDSVAKLKETTAYIADLRNTLLGLLLSIDGSHLNGGIQYKVDSNINIRFDGVSSQNLVALCDMNGICISSGSACNEGDAKPSHVLKAIGLSDEEALSSVRITLSRENTMDEMYYTANIMKQLIHKLRENN